MCNPTGVLFDCSPFWGNLQCAICNRSCVTITLVWAWIFLLVGVIGAEGQEMSRSPTSYAFFDLHLNQGVPDSLRLRWRVELADQLSRLDSGDWREVPREKVIPVERSAGKIQVMEEALALGLTLEADVVIWGTVKRVGIGSQSAVTQFAAADQEFQYEFEATAVVVHDPHLNGRVAVLGTLSELEEKFSSLAKDLSVTMRRLAYSRKRLTTRSRKNSSLAEESSSRRSNSYQPFIGGYGGYNVLLTGYHQYENGLSGGVEWRLHEMDGDRLQLIGFSVGLENFPMNVPPGTNGTSEDLMNVNGAMLFFPIADPSFALYAGVGVGAYLDWTRIHTPATGALSSAATFIGLSPRIGLEWTWGDVVVIPEIRLHYLLTPSRGSYSVVHYAFQVGAWLKL